MSHLQLGMGSPARTARPENSKPGQVGLHFGLDSDLKFEPEHWARPGLSFYFYEF
jgi:hypothetical protein